MLRRVSALAAALVACGSHASDSPAGTPDGASPGSSADSGSGVAEGSSDIPDSRAGPEASDASTQAVIVAVSVGQHSGCVLTAGGAVKCWGTNGLAGALGNDSEDGSTVPAQVTGLTSGVTAVSAGNDTACAITAGGGLVCWGALAASPVPLSVPGLTSRIIGVSVGQSNAACAVTAGGTVWCWDSNNNGINEGVLGNGSFDSGTSMVPVQVTGLTGATAISVGWSTACAITQDGGIECWGGGDYGQLGTDAATATCGDTPCSATPLAVTGLTGRVAAVSVGQDTACAVITDGAVECWGLIGFGVVAPGDPGGSSASAVPVADLSSVAAVSVGGEKACALTTGGSVLCWGAQYLGGGSQASSLVPVQATGLTSGVVSFSVGAEDACVVGDTGVVECWGESEYDDLLDGQSAGPSGDELVPTPQPGF
jgi:alpha-tubulin suppressor-like RCC1 family protein